MRSAGKQQARRYGASVVALALALGAVGCGEAQQENNDNNDETSSGAAQETSAARGTAAAVYGPRSTAPLTFGAGRELVEGRIERAIIDDFTTHKSRTEYFIRHADGRLLKLDFGGRRVQLAHGTAVRLLGDRAGDVLTVPRAPGDDEELVANQGDPGIAPLGAKKVVAIMVKYADDPNQPFSQEDVRQTIFTGTLSANAYIQENSFGKVSLLGAQRWDGEVYGWISVARIPGCTDSFNETGCCIAYGDAADAQLQQQGVNLSAWDYRAYVMPGINSCGASAFVIGDQRSWYWSFSAGAVAHELGHNFGAPHSNAWVCTEPGSGLRVPVAPDGNCYSDEYDDIFDVMGTGFHHMNAFNKLRLGYLAPANQTTWTADGDFAIGPIERHMVGLQSLRLPRPSSINSPESSHFYLEYRQPLGMFDTFSPSDPVSNGFGIRMGATDALNFPRTGFIDTGLDTTEVPDWTGDGIVAVGNAFFDPIDHYVVQPLSVSAASGTVRVLGNKNAIKINFQPSGAPVPPGYLVDSGSVYGNRGNGFTYGWNTANSANAVDLNSPETPGADQRYDTFNKLQAPGGATTWELAVANGKYWVRVAAGDASTNAVYRLAVEGVTILDQTPTATVKWFQRSGVVNVTDGKLTVTNGAGASNNKIAFIEVVSLAQAQNVFTANFNSGTDSFAYADNTFRGANQAAYANGTRLATGGVSNSGALQVTLGGINANTIQNMSGGWQRSFSLTTGANVSVTFSYNLTQTAEYEADEYSEVLASIDGALVGTGTNDYVARVSGNGNGGTPITTGWKTVTLNLGMLGAGTHTLTIGGGNNKKTDASESTDVRIDDVTVKRS